MKNTKLFIGFGVLAALIIGFLIGISVEYPFVDKNSVSGTISKINNYRKAQNATSDIQLKNDLVSDTTRLKSVQNLLNFYYFSAVKMSDDLKFALDQANTVESFKSTNQNQMTLMTSYSKYLTSARTDLLLAITVCKTPKEVDPLLLNDLLNQANNVVAQMNFKNRTVLQFIDVLASYVAKNKTGKVEELKQAHDRLMLNEFASALILRDKMVLNTFNKKELLADGKILKVSDKQELNKLIKQDLEILGLMDSEKLGGRYNDTEKLGSYYADTEKMGVLFTDTEKLGAVFQDTEKLGAIMINDSEKLGDFENILNDSEKLGDYVGFENILNDTERLGVVSLLNDSEKLGVVSLVN